MGSAWGDDSHGKTNSQGKVAEAVGGPAEAQGLAQAKGNEGKRKEDLRERLTPLEFHVTQENGTEPPFANKYWDNHEAGIYVDVVTGEPLFSSLDKFDSGTGWPSFTKPLSEDVVKSKDDRSHGMMRTEARSAGGDSHLGHIFPDGPGPTKTRYCINSAALRFIPVARLAAEGYGQFLELFSEPRNLSKQGNLSKDDMAPGSVAAGGESAELEQSSAGGGEACSTSTETATLAGGCFWGVEDIIRKFPGVLETEVGYTGGKIKHPQYKDVSGGASGHAEAVKITFDPTKVSYSDILRYFFRLHDPTTLNRQGNDIGTQYRSAIFVHSDAQRKAALDVIKEVNASGKWPRPVVTQVTTAGEWYPAEDYHQDYLVKNPGGYTCHYLRE